MSVPPSAPTAGRSTTGAVLVAVSTLAVLVQTYGLYRPDAPPQPGWLPYADKLGHVLGFAIPVALVLLTLGWFAGGVTRLAGTVVVVLFGLQALLSEAVQAAWFPDRRGDVADLIADALGIALGVALGVAAARAVRR